MNRKMSILMALAMIMAFTSFGTIASASTVNTTLYYGDLILDDDNYSIKFLNFWDLNGCPLTLSFTYDLSDASPPGMWQTSWSAVGLRNDADPWGAAWMSAGFPAAYYDDENDYDYTGDGIPDPNLDMDDKLNLGRWPNLGLWDEREYNYVCSVPPAPIDETHIDPSTDGLYGSIAYTSYGIWFDRDGVDPWQATNWGAQDGGTFNTGGSYDIEITYKALDMTKGLMCATVNGIDTGFYTAGWKNASPEIYPAGMSFDADTARMQVYAGVTIPSYGPIRVKDITVTGCLVLEEGMATGGGFFYPDTYYAITPGGKATFGFVAKQKNDNSSGQLEFQYHTDELNLKSTSYDWVTLATTQVMFEGVGRLNGEDGYKFRVRAVDGDKLGTGVDRFEIRIWTNNGDSFEMPTYRAEGDLMGGQIVVHKK